VAKKRLEELSLDGWELVEEEETPARTTVVVPGGDPEPAPAAPMLDEVTTQEMGTEQIEPASETPAHSDARVFMKTIPLIKGTAPDDERFVLGIVLEPEEVDAQKDIYSAAEIRTAAHRFMEDFQDVGLMHKMRVNGAVKIVESYLAPADLTVAGTHIKQGTWLLGVHVLSDALWEDVKDGKLTGFSIGGSARRVPDADAPSEAAA